jgi:hypothetical protein
LKEPNLSIIQEKGYTETCQDLIKVLLEKDIDERMSI